MAKGQKYHCGPTNAPKWLRKALSYKFNESCEIHDRNYAPDSTIAQRKADRKFLRDMIKQSRLNIFWILIALIYYITVRLFGQLRYKGVKK